LSVNHEGSVQAEELEPLIPRIRVTRRERNRLILVGVAGLSLCWLLSTSWDALGPFIFALVLGYLMMPLVDRLARFTPRTLAILTVYLIFITIVVGLAAWIVPAVVHQADQLSDQFPGYYSRVQEWFKSVIEWYNSLPLPDNVRESIENSLKNAGSTIGGAIQQALVGTILFISRTMGIVVGLFIIPFWLFYVLKDKDRGINAVNNMLPRTWRGDVWRIIRIVNGVLSSYIRGQLLLALAVGLATTVGMLIVGAPFPIILGIISGITEIIPVVGPIIGAIPGVVLAILAGGGDWVLLLKVLAVYIVVQQLENNLLVPKIQGDSVKLHPAIIMVALVVGSQVAGFVGLIAAVPVTAIARDVYLYLYRRFAEDYTAREAEASVPSRQDEESPKGKELAQKELAEAREQSGINTEDEMIAALDAHDVPDGSYPGAPGEDEIPEETTDIAATDKPAATR
jgi:predicted PurR-regulated permease PerM